MVLDNIIEEIKKANTIVVLTHESPDGDAIGSSLAMYNALMQLGKNVDVIMQEHPSFYNFLPGGNKIKNISDVKNYDLAIALDCGDIKRLNGFLDHFENAKCRISIDHHSVNTMFADYNFVNPVAPACAQILITVLEELGVEITKDIGTCLLTGIITDTGGFQYQGVTAETFQFAAELLEKGVNVSKIFKQVMQTISKKKFELKKRAIDRLELLENDKIAFTYITKQDEEECNSDMSDHEGIVEIGRNIENVQVSIFLREREDGFKISLRSNDEVNVADICLMFMGGGHMRAAGGFVTGPLEIAKERLLNECKKHLR